MTQAHQFALFVQEYTLLPGVPAGSNLVLKDHDTITRIATVLRLKVDKNITLFDTKTAYFCTISEITKKHIQLAINSRTDIKPIKPALHIVLPLLERDALEEVVYMATVHGAQTIELVATEKSKRALTDKDILRLQKIAISAAEQSKQFSLPVINAPVTLEIFLAKKIASYAASTKLWCDIDGAPLLETIKKADSYLTAWGPEGDFTQQEKELLKQHFTPVKLTSSVLRARDAASLIMGVIRL